jgi:hypothetical protein
MRPLDLKEYAIWIRSSFKMSFEVVVYNSDNKTYSRELEKNTIYVLWAPPEGNFPTYLRYLIKENSDYHRYRCNECGEVAKICDTCGHCSCSNHHYVAMFYIAGKTYSSIKAYPPPICNVCQCEREMRESNKREIERMSATPRCIVM